MIDGWLGLHDHSLVTPLVLYLLTYTAAAASKAADHSVQSGEISVFPVRLPPTAADRTGFPASQQEELQYGSIVP